MSKPKLVVCPSCGKERSANRESLKKKGNSICHSCNTLEKFGKKYIGETFGRLVIISDAEPRFTSNGKRVAMVVCQCSCGVEVTALRTSLFKGLTKSCGCLAKEISRNRCGEKHPSYNKKLTIEDRKNVRFLRNSPELRSWRKAVKSTGKCVVCGSLEKLVAHHLASFKDNPELRFSIDNGICLCAKCHIEYHTRFMGGYSIPATLESFDEFAREKNGE